MNDNTKEQSYEQLLAKITHPKQRLFLENLPKYNAVFQHTADAVGISDWTPYTWIHKDKNFKLAVLALKKKIEDNRLQLYEAELDKRILVNPSKQSDILLMFGLKALDPGKYRENPPVIPFSGNIKVELSVPRPGALPLQEVKQLKGGGKDATE